MDTFHSHVKGSESKINESCDPQKKSNGDGLRKSKRGSRENLISQIVTLHVTPGLTAFTVTLKLTSHTLRLC